MNILQILQQLRDDLKIWVTTNLNALNTKIDEKTIPIDNKLDSSSTNPVQNKVITKAINNIPKFSGDYNDLTNAPNITEDESGNMVIADESGNVIFKADADGIHTTAVSLNGEAAASEKYVDEAIANIDIPEVDFTGCATEDFVNTAIDSAKEELSESIVAESNEWKVVDEAGNIIFSVNESGAHTTSLTVNGETTASEKYVDNAIANINIPETDFTGYATETYVDNKVADLVNSAPEALNTLGELAVALENHEDAYYALLEIVSNKATQDDLENLKEELSKSITSEAEDWKIVDSNGNIIFSVDNTGAHTTNLTLNGEDVATEAYVNEAINNIEFPDTIARKSEVIPAPATASVGQTIAVKAVDENNKPTEWETVDMTGGVSSWNDLTDKPFYSEMVEMNVTFNGDLTGKEYYEDVMDTPIVKISDVPVTAEQLVGSSIIVKIPDGSNMEITVTEEMLYREAFSDSIGFIMVSYEETPLVYALYGDLASIGAPITEGTYFVYAPMDGGAVYTESLSCLSGMQEVVHKIDKKYFPEIEVGLMADEVKTIVDEAIIAQVPSNIFNGEGEYSVVLNSRENVASGSYAYAEGSGTIASGFFSHAEGSSSDAIGFCSHAEGSGDAVGAYSHAEGCATDAIGDFSHAEGEFSVANGEHSHAEGFRTIASGDCSHAQGRFNIEDTGSKYAHIVGNGKDVINRSNAHTLDWNGNAWFQGDVFTGGVSQDDEVAKKLATEEYVNTQIANIPTSGGSGANAIIDVTSLPADNINKNSWYRLVTGTLVFNQHTQDTYVTHCVESLPEVGKPATNADQSEGNVYYVVSSGEVYGYVDDVLSIGMSIPVGWYDGATLLNALGYAYNGTITDIDDDPCDGSFRIHLKYDFYIYQDGWCKLPFACEKAPKFNITWDGDMTDKFTMDLSSFGFSGIYLVKVSDNVFTEEQLIGSSYFFSNSDNETVIEKVSLDTTTYNGAINIDDGIMTSIYSANDMNTAFGLPEGYLTNGLYFIYNETEGYWVNRFVSPSRITKFDSKFLGMDIDMSNIYTKSEVETLIANAIGGAIGGSY